MLTFRDITFAVSDVSDVSEIFPFFVYAVWGRKGKPYQALGLFFFISGLIKLYTLITAVLNIHNLPAYHLLAFIEIAFVYTFYCELTTRKPRIFVIGFFLLLYAANTFIQPITRSFNSNTWTFTVVLIMMMGLSYLFKIYRMDEDMTPLFTRPDFVITAGLLIYASGSLFTYLMGTDILSGKSYGFFKNAWIFQCFANIFKNLIICYGFWLTGKRWRRQRI